MRMTFMLTGVNLVQHRNDESAAVDDDLFAQETGAYERRLFGGAAVEPTQNVNEDDDRDGDADQPQQHFPHGIRTHISLHSSRRTRCRPI